MFFREVWRTVVLAGVFCAGLLGLGQEAHADYRAQISETPECVNILRSPIKRYFRNPAEEIAYTNQRNNCWAESLVIRAATPKRSFLGTGMDMFASPSNIEALGFSKMVCKVAYTRQDLVRNDYPCWFEIATAQENISVEEAARRETPKLLFANTSYSGNGSSSVEYVLCTNDDPTKPKEYSKGCSRGKNLTITEYGRGDINNDAHEDIVVNIKFGNNNEDFKKCFMAAFSRKEGQLAKMLTYSPLGLCEN